MNRLLLPVAAAASFVAAATAQSCFQGAGGTTIAPNLVSITGVDPLPDEGRTPPTAMGITFPMAGAATALTHAVIETNGVMYLCDAAGAVGLPGNYTYGSLVNLRGPAGSSPRIAPYWRDLQNMPTGWDITAQSVPGVSYKVTWLNTTDYFATGPARSFSATLFATGAIELSYDIFTIAASAGAPVVVGVSAGNGVGSAATPASNFAAGGDSGALALAYETFTAPSAWDLPGATIRFVPNGAGGYTQSVPCVTPQASHAAYGAGCYTVSDSYYALFANATAANAGLQGQSINFLPTATTYLITSGGGAFVPPGAGAVNVFATPTDDGEIVVTPSAPLSTPQGPQAALRVHSNGVISWGAAGQTFPGSNSYTPTAPAFLAAANPGIWFWHDYSENEAGSGRIVREEIGGVLYVTWNDVENYSNPAGVNRSTVQAQVNLASGQITVVFQVVDGNATSTFGSATMVGYSPGGASVDGGNQNLATSLPVLVPTANVQPVALSAAPLPISTPTTGTVVTYTHTGVPEAAPGSGVYLGLTILSVGQDLAGTDLFFLGAPGCRLHVASLDATFSFLGVGSTQTTTFAIPAGVPGGFTLYAQGAAILAANSLPNGQNSLGVVLSNAVASQIQAQ